MLSCSLMSNLGKLGEDIVAEEYQKQGYRIVARNYIFPKGKQMGELDLVCSKKRELVFVEVKLRQSEHYGTSFEAVDDYKQAKLVRMAKLFIQIHPKFQDHNYRIDVAAVAIDKGISSVTILTNAIEDLD